ncbi:LacI family DNA-binding transcriptional regulator [Frigidibacter sp.]|uniref:LacI family DNA-binding transcriptional regulator n=1 Tax=Frigidibacter sp. TaxID=2586418 RepID=UPI0027343959|nr:LacI family DNA-binding transcriptional regulator [Frigidibacter sp.]MDP3340618.1 LacI family DNA-binding transcriptional regulator [Frigidibacter sp.]
MKSPTLHDVARSAGVSYSTADRVLNGRGGVAEKSAQRVQRAIEELGYRRDIHAANLSRRRNYRFLFLLPRGDHGFFTTLREALLHETVRRLVDRLVITHYDVPAFDAEALAAELSRINPEDYDCVALIGVDSNILDAAIGRLVGKGLPVITLVSDSATDLRQSYIGIDNVIAGRTAGRLMLLTHKTRTGRILPILGTMGVRDHRERLQGATEVISAPGSGLEILPPIEVQDRPEIMLDRVSEILKSDPAITGIYSIGGGNRGLVDLLSRIERNRPVVVLHELTPTSRAALKCGMIDAVIDQKPAEEISRAIDAMRAIADDLPAPDSRVVPTIYLADNLPDPNANGGWT